MAILADPAFAEQYDHTRLYGKGFWATDHVYDTVDGDQWCELHTYYDTGSITIMAKNHQFVLMIMDERWNVPKKDVVFRIDVDYELYEANGTADGDAVYVPINGKKGVEFITDFWTKSAIAVYTMNGDVLLRLSLKGSGGATAKLLECHERVFGKSPATSSDPFAGASTKQSDPF